MKKTAHAYIATKTMEEYILQGSFSHSHKQMTSQLNSDRQQITVKMRIPN